MSEPFFYDPSITPWEEQVVTWAKTSARFESQRLGFNLFDRTTATRPDKRKLTPADVILIKGSDESHTVLADRFGVDEKAIRTIRRGETYKNVGGKAKPMKTGPRFRKLTDEQVRFIRSSSLSGRALAESLGVSEFAISRIRTFKTYKDLR